MVGASFFFVPFLGVALAGSAPPDETDVFLATNNHAKALLLLDRSGSMADGHVAAECPYYVNTYRGPYTIGPVDCDVNPRTPKCLSRMDQLKAALTGCQSPNDGVLDLFADQIDFGLMEFGDGRAQFLRDFESSLNALEVGVLNMSPNGNTPMTLALGTAGERIKTRYSNAATPECIGLSTLLVSDGYANGNRYTYNFACDGARQDIAASDPELGSLYMQQHDLLCRTAGNQLVETYTLGVGSDYDTQQMTDIANNGNGVFVPAAGVEPLVEAFSQILFKMAARSVVFGPVPAVQREGLYTGNYGYIPSFQPAVRGAWGGNLKKNCFLPNRGPDGNYLTGPGNDECVFVWDGARKKLLVNTQARDFWSNTADNTLTALGGAGQQLFSLLGPANEAPTRPYYRRNLLSWRYQTSAYVKVDRTNWSDVDTYVVAEDKNKVINRLHGYSRAANALTGDPLLVREWPLGDPVHSTSVLLRYTESCESPGDRCFVAQSGNDGQLRFFNAFNGMETSALIPPELFGDDNIISKNQLRDLDRQPDSNVSKRYYLDGHMRLFHVDPDGDSLIDAAETAYLIFSLGRGGRGYFRIPVGNFNGILDARNNPIEPLLPQQGRTTQSMREGWSAPAIGQLQIGASLATVAVIPSGHDPAWADPATLWPTAVASDPNFQNTTVACTSLAPAAVCNQWTRGGYVDPGLIEVSYGPFSGPPDTIAMRFQLQLDADPADRMYITDGQGRAANALLGNGLPDPTEPWSSGLTGGWTNWVFDDQASVRMVFNGISTRNPGFRILNIETKRRIQNAPIKSYPTITIYDLMKWNSVGAPKRFDRSPDDAAAMFQIGKQCYGSPGLCVNQGVAPDLKDMVCPIVGEVVPYTVGGRIKALYWTDLCAQIWNANYTGTGWTVRRLLRLNNAQPGAADDANATISAGRNWRKMYLQPDVVPSTCTGRRSIALYFGTGDAQRPLATDTLTDRALNFREARGREVVGMIIDDGVRSNLTLDDLVRANDVPKVDLKLEYAVNNKSGWFLELFDEERSLRKPLVVLGRAHFKTFQPTAASNVCNPAKGVDRVLVMNNCTAEPIGDLNGNGVIDRDLVSGTPSHGDREAWTGSADIGSELLLFTPESGGVFVSHGDLATDNADASFGVQQTRRTPDLLLWRQPTKKWGY